MNKRPLLFLAVCFAAMIPYAGLAQGYNDPSNNGDSNKPYGEGSHAPVEVPPGMEMVNIGGIRMVVPIGTKISKKGSLLVMEGTDEYMARNLKEMDTRLGNVEASQADLRQGVDDLKRKIMELRKE